MNGATPRPLRICIATRAPFWGGAEVAALRLAAGLAERGHQPVMLLGQDGPVREQYEREGLRCRVFPLSHTSWGHAVTYVKQRRAIRQFLATEAFDVLHVNDLPTAQMCADAARPLRIATVVHHRFIYGCRALDWLNKFPPDRHAFVSAALRDLLHATSPTLAAEPGVVLHDGLPMTPTLDRSAAREQLDIAQDKVVVVFAGQLIERKGVADLLRAWGLLKPHLRQRSELYIVGDALDGAVTYRQELNDLVLQLSPSPRMVGFQRNVDTWLAAADLAVVPSHAEPLGNATLEAMRAGLPVIGSDVGGIPEMIDAERTGLLVPPQDPVALARALSRLISDPVTRVAYGKAGRARCESHFGLTRHIDGALALYSDLLGHERSMAA